MSHKIHEVYSGKNPVPKVALKSILDPSGATEAKARRLVGRYNKDQDEDQDRTRKMTKEMRKGEQVTARDPVTGGESRMKHGGDGEIDTNKPGENILSLECPPPDWSAHRRYVLGLARSAVLKIILAYCSCFLLFALPSFISSPKHFTEFRQNHQYLTCIFLVIVSLGVPSIFAYVVLYALHREAGEDFASHVWDSERRRGLAAGQDLDGNGTIDSDERIKESVEWLNEALRAAWPIINPDLFTSAVDMLEDIMQASVPRFVHSVRVADLGQGTNAMRITSMRSLPDQETDDFLEKAGDSKEGLIRNHVNLEISFAYKALPSGSTALSKAHNAHLLVQFFLGVKGVWEFVLPVWVEVTGVTGTARARVELIPDPPFIKTTLVTLMGLPRVSISAIPMAKSLPNVMNIPVLSSFIAQSIDAACAEYVAPKSLTLDLQQLISGDDIKKNTDAVGVVVVHIHRAIGLKKMDSRGSSDVPSADPYVTVTYSRQRKPLYSTRIILDDLNPCFEETAIITLDANAVKVREKVNLQLWDSDRTSADDMMGYVEIDVIDLLRKKDSANRFVSPLTSPDNESRPGTLEYSIGYFSKMSPNKELATDGSDPAVPEDIKGLDPDFREARAVALNDLEAAVLVTPPDPNWPCGIVSVQIHEIRGLGVKLEGREKTVLGLNRGEGEKGQDDQDEEEEEGAHLPSSYCTIALNDELVYSTRVKPITSSPTFNAGTERFARDWRTTHVTVIVRDSRTREEDPVLGIVFMKLSELLVNASEVTRFFPLENGIGHGSVRISVLFSPVTAKLPPNLLGFNSGVVRVNTVSAHSLAGDEDLLSHWSKCEIRFKVKGSEQKLSRKQTERKGMSIVWRCDDNSPGIPLHQRYNSSLVISMKNTSALKPSHTAMAVIWLRDLVDNEDMKLEVALWQTDNYRRLRQNYLPPSGNLDMWDEKDRAKMHMVGTIQVGVTFVPGITSAHEAIMDTHESSQKKMWDEVEVRNAVGLNEGIGNLNEENGSAGGENTEVSQRDVHVNRRERSQKGRMDDDSSASSSDEDGERGLMQKLRDWKQGERELHRQHRGVMQLKPARTAEWLKDNIQGAGQKMKNRFKMTSRQPDIETEV